MIALTPPTASRRLERQAYVVKAGVFNDRRLLKEVIELRHWIGIEICRRVRRYEFDASRLISPMDAGKLDSVIPIKKGPHERHDRPISFPIDHSIDEGKVSMHRAPHDLLTPSSPIRIFKWGCLLLSNFANASAGSGCSIVVVNPTMRTSPRPLMTGTLVDKLRRPLSVFVIFAARNRRCREAGQNRRNLPALTPGRWA